MRSLLILAGILVAALAAFALAWPRLVDAEALRAELARLLRSAGGSELQFQGAVRLELLPLPRVSIERDGHQYWHDAAGHWNCGQT